MTYKDGKVYTRQCSNNVYPKDYYSEENIGLTRRYKELGQIDFEKWFITNGLMTGNIEILSGSNKILQKLNYIANLLWEDKGFRELKDKEDISSVCMFNALEMELYIHGFGRAFYNCQTMRMSVLLSISYLLV